MLLLSMRNFIFLKNEAVELGFGFWRRISAGSCTVWQNGFWAQAALEQQSGSKQSLSPSTIRQQKPPCSTLKHHYSEHACSEFIQQSPFHSFKYPCIINLVDIKESHLYVSNPTLTLHYKLVSLYFNYYLTHKFLQLVIIYFAENWRRKEAWSLHSYKFTI